MPRKASKSEKNLTEDMKAEFKEKYRDLKIMQKNTEIDVSDGRACGNQDDRDEYEQLRAFMRKFQKKYPKYWKSMADWMTSTEDSL